MIKTFKFFFTVKSWKETIFWWFCRRRWLDSPNVGRENDSAHWIEIRKKKIKIVAATKFILFLKTDCSHALYCTFFTIFSLLCALCAAAATIVLKKFFLTVNGQAFLGADLLYSTTIVQQCDGILGDQT